MAESGKSVAAFCRERGVPASQLFSRKKELREAEAAKFLEVAIRPTFDATPAAARGSGI